MTQDPSMAKAKAEYQSHMGFTVIGVYTIILEFSLYYTKNKRLTIFTKYTIKIHPKHTS